MLLKRKINKRILISLIRKPLQQERWKEELTDED
jgi:hypothetical protein